MVFDVTKPAENTRFNSQQIRDNFEAVGRASDLKCFEQDPPDRTIYVQPGRYYTVTTASTLFPGGDTDPIDTTTGGLLGQERIVVVEITDAVTLYLNYGAWAAAGSAVAPTYNPSNIALAEVLVTFNDQEIMDDQITDVRPLINLGNTGTEIISPEIFTTTATPGQTNFDTSSSFTFVPNASELLVWTGGVFQTPVIDYTEPNDHTVQFAVPRPVGERVTIWKVGISAVPATMSLYDLSDVSGNEADAFHNADAATAINPFLTISGHTAIDHTTLPFYGPIAIHLSTTATSVRHHASLIEATDNFTFSSATNVQGVLDDVEGNIYQPFLAQHKNDGTHGPKVTIDQTTSNDALIINKAGVGTAVNLSIPVGSTAVGVTINNSGLSNGLLVKQATSASAAGIRIEQSANNNGLVILKSGAGAGYGIYVLNSGTDPSIYIEQAGNGKGLRIAQAGSDNAVVIEKSSPDASSAVLINNSGAGVALYVRQTSVSSQGIRVDQGTANTTIFLNKLNGGAGDVINISNSGSGYDIRGHNSNWWYDKSGNSLQNGNHNAGGMTTLKGLSLGPVQTRTIPVSNAVDVGGCSYVMLINPGNVLHRLTGGVDGQVVVFIPRPSPFGTIWWRPPGWGPGGGNIWLDWNEDNPQDTLTLMYNATFGYWVPLAVRDN